jgi:hypothetical protein
MSETTIFVTVHQLSERTGLPVSFLNTEAEAGRMPTKKIGRRTFFDVEAAVQTLTDPNAIERLTAERDEERTLVQTLYLPEIERLQCNLDKEESTSSFLREMLYDEVKQINSWLDEMQEQRDEARREVCALEADTIEDQREYAKQRGWDCFEITMCKEAQHDLEADTHPG